MLYIFISYVIKFCFKFIAKKKVQRK